MKYFINLHHMNCFNLILMWKEFVLLNFKIFDNPSLETPAASLFQMFFADVDKWHGVVINNGLVITAVTYHRMQTQLDTLRAIICYWLLFLVCSNFTYAFRFNDLSMLVNPEFGYNQRWHPQTL